jgi:anti-sigma-K factor RskA
VLALDVLEKPQLNADQHLQLWAVSREDGSVASLGAVQLEKRVETSLTKEQWGLITNAEYLLVSAETQSGVTAPGSRILAKGLCVKVEGWKS